MNQDVENGRNIPLEPCLAVCGHIACGIIPLDTGNSAQAHKYWDLQRVRASPYHSRHTVGNR